MTTKPLERLIHEGPNITSLQLVWRFFNPVQIRRVLEMLQHLIPALEEPALALRSFRELMVKSNNSVPGGSEGFWKPEKRRGTEWTKGCQNSHGYFSGNLAGIFIRGLTG
jgi:hypothetical protein